MKTNIVVYYQGKPANLISDKKKGTIICKHPFNKEPEFVIDIAKIETIKILTEKQAKNKSVIGRAIVGGILFGSLGAVAGGLSGIGQKIKIKEILCIDTIDGKTYLLPVQSGAAAGICVDVRHAKERVNKIK